MKKNNTLIKLFAGIIILAVIIVIATRNVVVGTDSARETAFRVESNNVLKGAEDALKDLNDSKIALPNDTMGCQNDKVICFSIDYLINLGYFDSNNNKYTGKVIIDKNDKANFELYLQKNNEFNISGNKEKDYTNKGEVLVGGFASNNNQTKCKCDDTIDTDNKLEVSDDNSPTDDIDNQIN